MDKTRIPKPGSSKLPLPSTTLSSISENKIASIKSTARSRPIITRPVNLRRSKSFSDIRSAARLHDFKATNVRATAATKPKPAPPATKTATKRTAPDKASGDAKPKRPKIPDWDYKSRFNFLKEAHTTMKENYEKAKTRLEALDNIEEEYNIVKAKATALEIERDELLESSKEYIDLKIKYKNLQASHADIVQKHEALTVKSNQDVDRIKHLENQITELTNRVEEQKGELHSLKETVTNLENVKGKLKLELDTAMRNNEILTLSNENFNEENAALKDLQERLEKELYKSELHRRVQHNTIQDLKGNIRVFCRVRPPLNEEEAENQCYFNFVDDATLEIRTTRESVSSITGRVNTTTMEFSFDKVFEPQSTQLCVFEELAQLVISALDGYHVCVFAYGQTGSGKTHTMQGRNNLADMGMIPRTIDLIFEQIEHLKLNGWVYSVQASFIEIYNENLRDLLDMGNKKSMDIRYNEGKGVTITNLRIEDIKSARELRNLMQEAHKNRAVAATDFNKHSSRSHALTKIYLEGTHSSSGLVYSGSINLVDLAGSESAKTSANERLAETKSINKSLSTLGSVMLALQNKENHVPYRNSKLTYLLQSCLGGNSKTLMFVNISPLEECYNESINSLRFASQVKQVKISHKRNKTYSNNVLMQKQT